MKSTHTPNNVHTQPTTKQPMNPLMRVPQPSVDASLAACKIFLSGVRPSSPLNTDFNLSMIEDKFPLSSPLSVLMFPFLFQEEILQLSVNLPPRAVNRVTWSVCIDRFQTCWVAYLHR